MAVLLTIEDLGRERDKFSIFGATYEVLSPDDFGPIEQARMFKAFKRVELLFKEEDAGKDISSADEKAAIDGLRQVVMAVLPDLPKKALVEDARFTPSVLFKIASAFIKALEVWQELQKAAKTTEEQPQPTLPAPEAVNNWEETNLKTNVEDGWKTTNPTLTKGQTVVQIAEHRKMLSEG